MKQSARSPRSHALSRRAFAVAGAGLLAGAIPGAAVAGGEAARAASLSVFALNTESWWTDDLPFERRFDAAARLGFTQVEFWSVYAPRDPRAIRRLCADAGVKPVQCTANTPRMADPAVPVRTFRDQVDKTLDAVTTLGASLVTVVGHEWIDGLPKEDHLPRYRDRLAIAAPMAAAANIRLIIEPFNPFVHPEFFLLGSQTAVSICREINSPALKINWDFFHMQRAEGNVVDAFRKGGDQAAYVQIADSPGRNEPGTGEMNYTYVLGEARRAGYRGPIGLEFWPTRGEEARVAAALMTLGASLP